MIRKCPHCKSNKGFEVTIHLGGQQYEQYSFAGKLLGLDRQGTDGAEKYVQCLSCKKSIKIEKVNYNF